VSDAPGSREANLFHRLRFCSSIAVVSKKKPTTATKNDECFTTSGKPDSHGIRLKENSLHLPAFGQRRREVNRVAVTID
jgi:hypothetical protein